MVGGVHPACRPWCSNVLPREQGQGHQVGDCVLAGSSRDQEHDGLGPAHSHGGSQDRSLGHVA